MSDMKQKIDLIHHDQRGVGSLLFTLVMMVVISLIVTGFAQLARRGQNEALNNQLSTQAYYAAETGVNDAVNALASGTPTVNGDERNCNQFATEHPSLLNPNLGNGISYTCLLVNAGALSELDYGNISPTGAEVIPLVPDNAAGLGHIDITWTTSNDTSDLSGCTNDGKLPPKADKGSGYYSCPYPMLRIELVPMSALTDRATAQANTQTVFVKPTTTNAAARAGGPVYAYCNATNCSYKTAGLGAGSYVMKLSSIYGNPLNVSISSDTGVTKLAAAQGIVDVTGKSQNVLRRIQVRVPLGDRSLSTNGSALVSNQSICKRFTAGSGFALNDDSSNGCLN